MIDNKKLGTFSSNWWFKYQLKEDFKIKIYQHYFDLNTIFLISTSMPHATEKREVNENSLITLHQVFNSLIKLHESKL